MPAERGEMKSVAGETKGRHEGLMYYTIGQRQGLGIGGAGDPWFVVGKNLEENVLYVGQSYTNDALYSDGLIATDVNWIHSDRIPDTFTCTAKFRYRQDDSEVKVEQMNDGKVYVEFSRKERAITPGQAVVFYDGDVCLGGATIDEVIKDEKALDYVG